VTPRPRLRGPTGRLVPDGSGAALSVGFAAAVMTFLAVLLLALALAADRLADQWSGELSETATLQVFAAEDAVEAQARAALEVLRTTPGVRSVRIVEPEEQQALLAPWFGTDLALDALPLPLLIEVAADRDRLDREGVARRLAAEAPGAVFDDHAAWLAPIVAAAERLRIFAFACLALVALALLAVLSLAATAAVAANGEVVQTLRLVGARDGFIGAAFARRLTLQASAGAALGALAGLALLAFLPHASEQGFFLVGVGPQGIQWLAPALVPLACAVGAWIAVRLAVRAQLRRWS
jgi:cell division transport system permease protein